MGGRSSGQYAVHPRSYIVRDQKGKLKRRNKYHLRSSHNLSGGLTPNEPEESDGEFTNGTDVSNGQGECNDESDHNCNSPTQVNGSGTSVEFGTRAPSSSTPRSVSLGQSLPSPDSGNEAIHIETIDLVSDEEGNAGLAADRVGPVSPDHEPYRNRFGRLIRFNPF